MYTHLEKELQNVPKRARNRCTMYTDFVHTTCASSDWFWCVVRRARCHNGKFSARQCASISGAWDVATSRANNNMFTLLLSAAHLKKLCALSICTQFQARADVKFYFENIFWFFFSVFRPSSFVNKCPVVQTWKLEYLSRKQSRNRIVHRVFPTVRTFPRDVS